MPDRLYQILGPKPIEEASFRSEAALLKRLERTTNPLTRRHVRVLVYDVSKESRTYLGALSAGAILEDEGVSEARLKA